MTEPSTFRHVTDEGVVFVVPTGWKPDARASRCKAEECRAVVLWAETHNGRKAILNTDGTSHFASCPAAERFRKPR